MDIFGILNELTKQQSPNDNQQLNMQTGMMQQQAPQQTQNAGQQNGQSPTAFQHLVENAGMLGIKSISHDEKGGGKVEFNPPQNNVPTANTQTNADNTANTASTTTAPEQNQPNVARGEQKGFLNQFKPGSDTMQPGDIYKVLTMLAGGGAYKPTTEVAATQADVELKKAQTKKETAMSNLVDKGMVQEIAGQKFILFPDGSKMQIDRLGDVKSAYDSYSKRLEDILKYQKAHPIAGRHLDDEAKTINQRMQKLGQVMGEKTGANQELDKDTALQFLKQAGGDKDKARAMAKKAGYNF